MIKLSQLSIRHRTLLLGLFPAILMFSLLISLFIWQRINDAKVDVSTVGEILSSQLAASIEYPVISGNFLLLEPLVESAISAPAVVRVSITAPDGSILYQRQTHAYAHLDKENIAVYMQSVSQEQEDFSEFSEFDDIRNEPIVKTDIAFVSVELSHVLGRNRALSIVAKSVVWAGFILLACLLLARKMAKSIALPIERVSEILSSIAKGQLDTKIQITDGSEIGKLQEGVNAMAKALKHSETVQINAMHDLELSRKKAEEANKAKSEFLAIVSHELRTPINGAMGAMQLIAYHNDKEIDEFLNIADRSLNNLLELVEDMLTLGSLEKREQSLDIQPTHIPNLLRHTLFDLEENALQNDNKLMIHLDHLVSEKSIEIDGIKFRQLVRHLLGNAVKFTRNGRIYCSIYLEHGSEGLFLKLDISDNGVGFPEEQKAVMFEAFKQKDTSFSREFDGLGIGLTICHDIIQIMDGHLEIMDNSPKGAVINCSIPVGQVIEADQIDHATVDIDNNQLIKVLIVEDNRVNRIVAEKILRNMKCDPVSVESGKECVERYKSENFDMIFMDCHMPDMDGFETTQAIRAIEHLRNSVPVPIIALTANTSIDVRQECKTAGMSDYVAKPIKVDILHEVINRWV